MLRITMLSEGRWLVRLKLEGRIVSDWVALLENACLEGLRKEQTVVLDFAAVSFVDCAGVTMLRKMATDGVQSVNVSPHVEDLLRGACDQ